MSRSNPIADLVHPSTRWFEWRSTDKQFSYYDKTKKENVAVPLPFTFIVLDRTATIRGYNKKMKSGIHSNEIRDTRTDPLVVKFFKGGPIAQGLWLDIKDTIIARSGKFGVNLYVAYKEDKILKIGAIQLTGCALGAWFEFEKKHKKEIFEKAIVVKTSKADTSGDVDFNFPVFSLVDITPETEAVAKDLDAELQAYLTNYFKRPTAERAATRSEHPAEAPQGDAPDQEPEQEQEQEAPPEEDTSDVPF